jgi:hypothetical protein
MNFKLMNDLNPLKADENTEGGMELKLVNGGTLINGRA